MAPVGKECPDAHNFAGPEIPPFRLDFPSGEENVPTVANPNRRDYRPFRLPGSCIRLNPSLLLLRSFGYLRGSMLGFYIGRFDKTVGSCL